MGDYIKVNYENTKLIFDSVYPFSLHSLDINAPFNGNIKNILFTASGTGKYLLLINDLEVAKVFTSSKDYHSDYSLSQPVNKGDKITIIVENMERISMDMYAYVKFDDNVEYMVY